MLLAAPWTQGAERVEIDRLPDPVKRALTATGAVAIKGVTVRTLAGKTVYDVELERDNAPNPHVLVAADGTLLSDSRQQPADTFSAAASVYSEFVAPVLLPKVKLTDLPVKVQETIVKKAEGREVATIRTDTLDGRMAYRIEFQERGRNSRLYIAEDGTLLRPEEIPPVSPIGTKFADTPAAVQQTIRREAGDGEITKIHRKGLVAEPTTYTVDIRGSRGAFQLAIAETGVISRDSRNVASRPEANK